MKALTLLDIGRRVNGRQDGIDALEKQAKDKLTEWLREISLQGQDLQAAKRDCPHGSWLAWLAEHCPKTSYEKAKRYMRVAANWARVTDLQAQSLRQALAICEAPAEQTQSKAPSKSWPGYIEALGRAAKLTGYLERCPIIQWPEEGRTKLREDLRPIAEQLWPEYFGSSSVNTVDTDA